jgi:copper homeostasis protein
MPIIIEVCCGSLAEARTAKLAGADRIELNSGLSLGGLTPSIGTMRLVKKIGIPSMVMVRPRGGGFCYNTSEFETMLADTLALVEEGAEGIVFGILNADSTVDESRCRKMMDAIGGKAEAVFHRAMDEVPDWRRALDTLCGLGVRRVLTGGQKLTAEEGSAVIQEMKGYAAGRIEILPGGGVRKHNVRAIIEKTGCNQAHFSMRKGASGPDGEAPLMSEAELAEFIRYAR